MLTADLVRARPVKGVMKPQFLAVDEPSVAEDATWLCEVASDALQRRLTRGEIDETLAAEAQIRPDHKQLNGLAKILFDRCRFDTECPVTPKELREKVFLLSAQRGPLAIAPDPFDRPTAEQVLAEVGAELGLSIEAVREALYADRKQEQRLLEMDALTPETLVQRYNVGLVQALLLRASAIEVTLVSPPAARVRQLLRYVKFHELMHRATRKGKKLTLQIDGPESVLKQSSRYGLKLATFFPALLLNDTWKLKADLIWKDKPRTLSLDESTGLVTHYKDRGGYTPRVAKWFAERFAELETDWVLSDGKKPLTVGGHVVMPDFTLTRGTDEVHLEILGYWRRDYLERRLEAFAAEGPTNLILAVSKKLVADKSELKNFPGAVVPFTEIVPAKKVIAAAEAMC